MDPHFHTLGSPEGPVSEINLIPDGTIIPVEPDYPALEGTEITYVNGATIRRYKMIQGTWRYWTLT
jgi:hypothetical protein